MKDYIKKSLIKSTRIRAIVTLTISIDLLRNFLEPILLMPMRKSLSGAAMIILEWEETLLSWKL